MNLIRASASRNAADPVIRSVIWEEKPVFADVCLVLSSKITASYRGDVYRKRNCSAIVINGTQHDGAVTRTVAGYFELSGIISADFDDPGSVDVADK